MKILDLPLKAKWYDMIESGVKPEEYREIKPYWGNGSSIEATPMYDFVMATQSARCYVRLEALQ